MTQGRPWVVRSPGGRTQTFHSRGAAWRSARDRAVRDGEATLKYRWGTEHRRFIYPHDTPLGPAVLEEDA